MTEPAPSRLFDPGMQPERTALAWRRTSISMGAGALVALRIFAPAIGGWAIVFAALAFAIAVAVFAAAELRYRRNHRALVAGRDPGSRVALAGGALIALTATSALAFGLIAAVILLASEFA